MLLQLIQEKFDFFPLNRALSLSAMDEGSTDSKVDDLLRYVTLLVEKQREEVSKKLNFAKEKQKIPSFCRREEGSNSFKCS